MNKDRKFRAGEAATITTVAHDMQRNWRRFGFLEASDGSKAEFGLRDLSRMRLLKALVDHPTAIGSDVEHVTEELLDSMHSALLAQLNIEENGEVAPMAHPEMLAVIAFGRQGYKYSVVFDFADIQRLHQDDGIFDFTTMMVINLAALARQMAAKIELVGLDRRAEALDEEMAKRGL